jgi:hypothetical protein
MGLKRKRSSAEMSPSSTTSSLRSPSTRGSASPPPNWFQVHRTGREAEISNFNNSLFGLTQENALSTRLNCRTRKRTRNRPDEGTIHGTFICDYVCPNAVLIVELQSQQFTNSLTRRDSIRMHHQSCRVNSLPPTTSLPRRSRHCILSGDYLNPPFTLQLSLHLNLPSKTR